MPKKKKIQTKGFDLSKSKVRELHFFNDYEMLSLMPFVSYQEFGVLLSINTSQKINKKRDFIFKIQYFLIEEKMVLGRDKIKRLLKSLQEKGFLLHLGREEWTWNLPGIFQLFQESKPKEEIKPLQKPSEKIKSTPTVFLHTPLGDPILDSLPEGWENI
jgi:hypothetical protein